MKIVPLPWLNCRFTREKMTVPVATQPCCSVYSATLYRRRAIKRLTPIVSITTSRAKSTDFRSLSNSIIRDPRLFKYSRIESRNASNAIVTTMKSYKSFLDLIFFSFSYFSYFCYWILFTSIDNRNYTHNWFIGIINWWWWI